MLFATTMRLLNNVDETGPMHYGEHFLSTIGGIH